MSFGGKSRREAQQAQVEALRRQNAILDQQDAWAQEYRRNFDTRNAGIISLQKSTQNWLNRYEKGADVSTLNPARVMANQQAADQVVNTMRTASKLGDRQLGGDADYQAKLNAVSTSRIGQGLARLNEAGLVNELNSRRGILMDTSAYLASDERAGFGLGSEVFNMSNAIFQNATTRRQMEMQRSQLAMGMFTSLLSGGLAGFSSVMSAGASGGWWGSASGGSSGGGN